MHHNHFNLIRMFAASLVLVSHSFVLSTGSPAQEPLRQTLGVTWGSIAVDIFFVTSGFLVTMSLFRRGDLGTFVLSRALRIYPGLLVALLLTVSITGLFFSAVSLQHFWTQRQTWKYLAVNAVLVWPWGLEWSIADTLIGVPYTSAKGPPLNGSLWTLPIEIRMYAYLAFGYLAAGWLLPRLRGGVDRHGIAKVVLPLVALIGLALDLRHALDGHHETVQHLFTMFFVGSALWVWNIDWRRKGGWAIGAVAAIVAAAMIDRHVFLVVYTLTLPFIVLALAYSRQAWLLGYNRLGDYSYGIYIYAFPVQQWCAYVWKGIAPIEMIVSAFAVTLALAIGSWHLVEKRALALKPGPRSHARLV
jgi:peptidoglycan/LPS O-acetylase OafA/YrhL